MPEKRMALSFPDAVIAATLTGVVVVAGWYAAHFLIGKRDPANKRRDLRVQYFVEAYRRLEFAGMLRYI